MHIEATKVRQNGEASNASKGYAAALLSDCAKHVPRVHRLKQIFEKMLVEAPDEEQLPKLLKQVEQAQKAHNEIMMWAERMALKEPTKRRKTNK